MGKSVHFKYPGREGARKGTLKDRVIVRSGPSPDGRSAIYWDVVDLIEFHGDKPRIWIRIGYYRQVGDTMRWAGQTTITEPVRNWERLIFEAAREKPWFKKIILSAISKL